MCKKVLSLALSTVMVLGMSTSVFAKDKSLTLGNYNYSVQEIVDEVNNEYDVDMDLTPARGTSRALTQSLPKLTEEEFRSILNERAKEISEQNALAEKTFEEKTGLDYDQLTWEKAEETNSLSQSRSLRSYSCTKKQNFITISVRGIINNENGTKRFRQIDSVKHPLQALIQCKEIFMA